MDTSLVDNQGKALPIIREIDLPWLRLYPDMGNLAAAGYNPATELQLARSQILGIHVKDTLPGVTRGVPFMKGIVPFQETFRSLAKIGFWGLLGVEMWGDMHNAEDPVANAAAARRLVDRFIADAWPGE